VREIVGTKDAGSVYRLAYTDVRFGYPWHMHPEVEVKHVIRGSGTRFIGESVEPFADGDFVIVGGWTPHCWSSEPVRGKWVRAELLQFSPELFADRRGFAEIATFLEDARRGIQLSGDARDEAARLLSSVLEAKTETRQLALLLTLLSTALESTSARRLSAITVRSPQVDARARLADRVLRFVEGRAASAITEEGVAKEFGMSPSAFSRFFRRELGKPFSRHLAELRVAAACNLLLSEDVEVRAIAERVGFGTVASLNRQFRALKRMTPSAFRKRARELRAGLRTAVEEVVRCEPTPRRAAP
jgi:AraC-like DNA-binding protein